MLRKKWILFLSALWLLVACNSGDHIDGVDADQAVGVTFSFSVSSARQTAARMATEVTQSTNSTFRGITDVRLIPFRKGGKITAEDRPLLATIGTAGEGGAFDKTSYSPRAYFYLYDDCWVMPGTDAFLYYAKAASVAGKTDKASNGSLEENFPDNLYPADINFRPESILKDNVAPPAAVALANYLTSIAQTGGWATSHHPALRTYFQNFTGQMNGDVLLIAGSGSNVRAHVNALYDAISGLSLEAGSVEAILAAAILKQISTYSGVTFSGGRVTSLGSLDGYPGSVGLPDGAAALRWDGSAFVPQTETTTLASINSLTRFAYPADLRYFANSRIKTSNLDKRAQYYAPTATWDDMLENYEHDNATVNRNTRAVAIKDPVQYAVACLQLSLRSLSAATLKDAAGRDIPIAEGAFPLTGIIIGGQHPVDYSFLPKQPQSDVDTRFVYDKDLRQNAGSYYALSTLVEQTAPLTTLVLQNYDEEEVPVVLEFTNNGSQSFKSLTGIVYPGTKFYLVGKLKPESVTETTPDYERRVFTQDYTTTAKMVVASLANSYNILPDLLSPRLEVGVEIVQDWMQADPVTVIIQ